MGNEGRRLTKRETKSFSVLAVRHAILGSEFYAESELQQMAALARRGHRVRIIVPRIPGARKPSNCMVEGFTLDTVLLRRQKPWLSLGQFILAAFFHTAFAAGHVDCVIMDIQSVPFLFPLVLLRRLTTHLPVLILWVPTNPVNKRGLIKTILRSFQERISIKLAGAFFDKILFISPMLRDLYCLTMNVPREKTGIWSSSVDLRIYDPNTFPVDQLAALRTTLNIRDSLAVIYHGYITKARGLMESVKAMELLKQEGANAKLILLGYGPFREEIIRYVQLNHLEDVVAVPDPAESSKEVAKYLAASDVELIPMPDHVWWRYQCFIKVLECLAMNKPLISTDLPAVKAIVDAAPVVYWLKGSSARNIADGLRDYLKNHRSLRPSSGRTIASEYSVERVAEELEANIAQSLRTMRTQ